MIKQEQQIISKRIRAGLKAARKRGRAGGRPKGLSKEALYNEGRLTVNEICERLGIARATLYSYLRSRGWK